jgi:MFS family permease
MRYKQLALIFIANLVPLFIGMGLFPLLPLYAAQFGATRTLVGIYYAVVYFASASGVFLTGWLAARIPPRGLFIAGSLLGIPALALLGQATALWQIVLLTAVVWLCGAITLTLLGVYTGLVAEDRTRGRSFSLMFLAYPLGAVLGGTVIGQLVAWRGYGEMFATLAAIWAIQPLTGILGLRDQRFTRPATRAVEINTSAPLGPAFVRLLLSSLVMLVATNIGRLGIALSMQAAAFDLGAIVSTATVSGLATIPATLLLGAMSDRLGRARSLLLSYLLAAGGIAALILAAQLWHFWLAATLLFVAWCASRAGASALAADLLPQAVLGRGLPRLTAMDSLASIIGFASAGYALDTIGANVFYLIAVALVAVACQLLGVLPGRRWAIATAPQPTPAPSNPRHATEAAQ